MALKATGTKHKPPSVRIESQRPHHLIIRMDVADRNWEQWFLLSSDRHHDNSKCDWDLERQHLDEALERRAGILDAGDLFCAMQGKWDKRSDIREIRPEHQCGDYLDTLVSTAAEFYAPYAKNWLMLSPGNHEGSIHQKHETNLTERLAERLRAAGAEMLHVGSYSGFVTFVADRHGSRSSFKMHWHHGYGGGGPVTRDVIQSARKAVYLPTAKLVWSGHTHDQWAVDITRIDLDKSGEVVLDMQKHIKTAGYKNEYAGMSGWAVSKGINPKPLGALWLRLFWTRRQVKNEEREWLDFEIRETKP